ncbi:hypothetical protein LCGC14_1472420, partial [marine sediment metagenome]
MNNINKFSSPHKPPGDISGLGLYPFGNLSNAREGIVTAAALKETQSLGGSIPVIRLSPGYTSCGAVAVERH